MNLPYVIDNRAHTLADVLNDLLRSDAVHALDVATAYVNVGAFDLVQDGADGRHPLADLASFRLLLGSEPGTDDLGLRQSLRRDLDEASFDQETLRQVETLIRFLRRQQVAVRLYEQGFLHAKAYLCFADRAPGDRFTPVAGIVGSSNFTRAGLTTNQELNLTHKSVIDEAEADDIEAHAAVEPLLQSKVPGTSEVPGTSTPTRRAIKSEVGARAILELLDWYDERWAQARDFKPDLIALLNESKFGDHEYTPYQIYLKALYEYFRDRVASLTEDDELPLPGTRSAVELTRFQEDAVKKARRILARYDGVLVADSVGLGKTWIGKKLLEDTAYHRRQKALVICPASLREMWRAELREAAIPAEILSQEMLGREGCETRPYHDSDVILAEISAIDESHNFRNHRTNRYENLERLIGANGGRGRGRDGESGDLDLEGCRGLFFYFTAPAVDGEERRHFWRYYDLASGQILDNRYEIANLIRCGPDEPRVVGEGVDVFEIQDRVIADILSSVEHRQAVEAAPKILDDVQQLAATVLQAQRNNPALSARAVDAALQTLREPLPGAYIKDLREAYETYQRDGDVEALLVAVQELETAGEQEQEAASADQLTREELQLICWEYVWS